jgi:hypothetical protein
MTVSPVHALSAAEHVPALSMPPGGMVIHSHTTDVALSASENDGHAPEPGDGGGGVAATAHNVTNNDSIKARFLNISRLFRHDPRRIGDSRHDSRMFRVLLNTTQVVTRPRVLQVLLT